LTSRAAVTDKSSHKKMPSVSIHYIRKSSSQKITSIKHPEIKRHKQQTEKATSCKLK